jgi:cytochrome c biogenesis protein CcdA
MIDAPLALAFTAGMVATVNPCGFAMLPAYLGYFLGLDSSGDRADTAGVGRALLVGSAVSAGFLALFAVAGALVSWTSIDVVHASPWLTVVIGLVVAVIGLAFVAGWDPAVVIPKPKGTHRDQRLRSMFVFGLSYAIASLSCTLPAFTGVVASTFSRESLAAGVATFVAYGLGMAMLLMVLTMALALAHQGMVTGLRRALPHVQRASGLIMALMGAYLVWYGIYEIRLIGRGEDVSGGPVDTVTAWSSDLSERLYDLDPLQTAMAFALLIAVGVLIMLLRSGEPRQGASRPIDQDPSVPRS